jgi:hypothetical protein
MASSPKPPDPYKQAAADQSAAVGAAGAQSIVGNPNTYTPYGSQTYSVAGWEQVPDATGKMINVPRYNMQQQLSPDQMTLLGYQTQAGGNLGLTAVEQSARMREHLNKGVDTSGLQAWNAGPGVDRQGIEDTMMASYRRQADPQQASQNAQLAARGLNPGGQGYGTVQQGWQDAAGEASRQAYLNSFDLAGQSADRQNALRQSQLAEQMALRNQPITEIAALMGGSMPTLPQFQQYQSQGVNAAQPGNYMGQNYQIAAQNANALNSGLFGLGGSLLGGIGSAGGFGAMFSDRRLKQDIEPLNARLAGVPLYRFRYKADPATIHVGVMADEARPLHPDVVMTVGGFDAVDYGRLQSRHGGF